jgi:hypothetical protein
MTNIDIEKLPLEINGRGEIKGYKFKQLDRKGKYCLYEAKDESLIWQ